MLVLQLALGVSVPEANECELHFRRRAIADGSHVVDAEPQDYTDAFLMKMKEEAENNVTNTTFE